KCNHSLTGGSSNERSTSSGDGMKRFGFRSGFRRSASSNVSINLPPAHPLPYFPPFYHLSPARRHPGCRTKPASHTDVTDVTLAIDMEWRKSLTGEGMLKAMDVTQMRERIAVITSHHDFTTQRARRRR
ncbi:hypothetical protein DRN79_03355, partial [Methanosarcinales archaeon]